MTPSDQPTGPDANESPHGADVDEAGQESFPSSDPPATWAGPEVIAGES